MTQEEEMAREIVIKMQFQKEPIMFEQAKHCALVHIECMIDMLKYHGTDIGEKYTLLRLTVIKEIIRVL
jgi:uncharacterized protein YutE (UPF0331/DUF86 family)